MRIAILSTLASGGAGAAAWRISSALTDIGHECSFFILEGSGNPLHIPLLGNDSAFWLPALFKYWSDLTTPETLSANAVELFSDTLTALAPLGSLPEAIRNAEVIHLHWVAGMVFSPSLLQAMASKKVVWTLHDENAFTGGCHYAGTCRGFETICRDCPLIKRTGKDDASARCFSLKAELYPLLSPSLVAPSAWLAEKVKGSVLFKNYPVTTIPNPLAIESFRPPQDRYELRKKLGLPEDAFVILSGCEDLSNPRKNAKILFEALTLLSEEALDAPVTVVTYGHGQPPELAFPIHHFGYVDNETRMAELYGAAEIFVHTSLQDNLPLTLCEAQACGTPTLCFNVGGCPETMLPGETGFLVTETSSQALAEKLKGIIADRGSLTGMREAARAFAERRFDPATIAVAYTEVFEKAQIAPGLKPDDPLFDELVQNQIASLASFLSDVNKRIDNRLDGLEARLSGLEARLDGFETRFGGLDARLGEFDARHDRFETRFGGLDARLDEFDARVDGLDARFGKVDARLSMLEMFRWNLRHPFLWFFRKLRSKLRKSDIQG